MPAQTISTIGLARVGIKKIIMVEDAKVPKVDQRILGNVFSTRQEYERFKQIKGFSAAVETNEAEGVAFESFGPLYQRDFTPKKRTKGIKLSEETSFTDQYGVMTNLAPHFARAFRHARNQTAANLLALGFSSTSMGMNSETLFSTSHAMGALTGANRPSTELALGPLALQQALQELRRQKDAQNLPMPSVGKVFLFVPPELEFTALALLQSVLLPGTGDNDANTMRNRFEVVVVDYLTSSTAWFLRAADDSAHGFFGLNQMPYKVDRLELDEYLVHKWVVRESYVNGWYDWHGSWGTTGAP